MALCVMGEVPPLPSNLAVVGSMEAVYASTGASHASPVDWVVVAVFTYCMAFLKCRCARGHAGAHVAKQWPTRSALMLVAPLKSRSAIDNREISSPVEEGARGEVEGSFIAKDSKTSTFVR